MNWKLKALLQSLIGKNLECPEWPPDVFAVAATVLSETGGYVWATCLGSGDHKRSWNAQAKRHASQWKIATNLKVTRVPTEVLKHWDTLIHHGNIDVDKVHLDTRIVEALIKLLAISDNACSGFGIDFDTKLLEEVLLLLAESSHRSLTRRVNPNRARVLPKQRTPQVGLTLRSLSHHLSLIRPRGVVTRWHHPMPVTGSVREQAIVNLVLCPWPLKVEVSDFSLAALPNNHKSHVGHVHRFFAYDPKPIWTPDAFQAKIEEQISLARQYSDDLHFLVFPECALSVEELGIASKIAWREGLGLISGVRKPSRNTCAIDWTGLVLRAFGESDRSLLIRHLVEEDLGVRTFQDKHHRWSLDQQQIIQYRLGGKLPISKQCWEAINVLERRLGFFTLQNWLTWTVLICEDLARQDPVAEILRSVGPNLVIALLMDGPQLKERWSARFASVLADDPGSSVLTLTSLGMVHRSNPIQDSREVKRDRVIGLWRDAITGVRELELPGNAIAGLLSISPSWSEEWTADGRSDNRSSCTPTFAGFTPLATN